MKWFAYMLRCADGSYYPGITTDIHRRLRQHNGKEPGGAKYTRGRRPVRLVFYTSYETKSEAAKREAYWKTLSHDQKKGWDHSLHGRCGGAAPSCSSIPRKNWH